MMADTLPDDLFLVVVHLLDPSDVGNLAMTCRSWKDQIERLEQPIQRSLWQSDMDFVCFKPINERRNDAFEHIEDVIDFLKWEILDYVNAIRGELDLEEDKKETWTFSDYNLERKAELQNMFQNHFYGSKDIEIDRRAGFIPKIRGTTATFHLKAKDVYFAPVYYDWEANWDKVSELIKTDEVQKIISRIFADGKILLTLSHRDYQDDFEENYSSVEQDRDKDFVEWPNVYWQDEDEDIQDAIIDAFVPKKWKMEHNKKVADLMQLSVERLLRQRFNKGHLNHLTLFRICFNRSPNKHFDELTKMEAKDMFERIKTAAKDIFDKFQHNRKIKKLIKEFREKCREYLEGEQKEAIRRSLLLMTCPSESHDFLPLNYKLAQLLSPPGTKPRVLVTEANALVVDETRNIVFDTSLYFTGITAGILLQETRERPELPNIEFDYSSGRLRRVQRKGKKRKHHDKLEKLNLDCII